MAGAKNIFKELATLTNNLRKTNLITGVIFFDIIKVKNKYKCIYFSDFGDNFTVFNRLGKNSIPIAIENITNAKPGVVTLKDPGEGGDGGEGI